ncbi:hypothetical protein FJY84_04680 [Candidatus Bathyarchaeota archaeon]|nr:hypothetical protein [Candidatus Bathyarchaeota archaeon]
MLRDYVYRVLGWCPRLNLGVPGEKPVSNDPDIPQTVTFKYPKCNSPRVRVLGRSPNISQIFSYELQCLDCKHYFTEGLIYRVNSPKLTRYDMIPAYRGRNTLDKMFNVSQRMIFEIIPIGGMIACLGLSIITYLLNDIGRTFTLLSGAMVFGIIFVGYKFLKPKKITNV